MWRKAVLGSLLVLVIFGLIVWWFWPRERLTEELLAQIKPGMKLSEVIQLLGEPLDRMNDYPLFSYHFGVKIANQSCNQISLESKNAWLPKLTGTPDDEAIVEIEHERSNPTQYSFWIGQEKMLWVIDNAKDFQADKSKAVVNTIWVLPLKKEGGGPWGWLTKKYEKWGTPKMAPTATRPLPPVPAAPMLPANQKEPS